MAASKPKKGCFSTAIVETLESLSKAGMNGIGETHKDMIETACIRTGLTEDQVKVSSIITH